MYLWWAVDGEDEVLDVLGFNAAGDVIFIERPNMQTLDYIKRGLDDVLEKYCDSTTGILRLDGGLEMKRTKF